MIIVRLDSTFTKSIGGGATLLPQHAWCRIEERAPCTNTLNNYNKENDKEHRNQPITT